MKDTEADTTIYVLRPELDPRPELTRANSGHPKLDPLRKFYPRWIYFFTSPKLDP